MRARCQACFGRTRRWSSTPARLHDDWRRVAATLGSGTRTGSRTRRSRGSRASRPNGIHAGRAPPGAAGIRGWGLRLLTRRKISTASTLRHPRSRAPGKERSVAAHRPQSTAVSEAASVLGRSAA